MQIHEFIGELASRSPTPGGGGASALLGAVSSALCSMVANLTSGKPKYAAYQADIERILSESAALYERFEELMKEDEEAFLPLSEAYAIPKGTAGREIILEEALKKAALAPLEMLAACEKAALLASELAEKGSTLAISDAGVAAAACEAAARGAALNVYINTSLMKNREPAETLTAKAAALEEKTVALCESTYQKVRDRLL